MKRNLFDELNEGLTAIKSERERKITLKHFTVEKKPGLTITPEELLTLRERLNLSRSVFARYLRINERTLENWEQGRARPNA
jgi:putative transcriptional regulator